MFGYLLLFLKADDKWFTRIENIILGIIASAVFTFLAWLLSAKGRKKRKELISRNFEIFNKKGFWLHCHVSRMTIHNYVNFTE